MKKVLVTGADGFIGKNLCESLRLVDQIEVLGFTRQNSSEELNTYLEGADFVFHLAGVNRPKNEDEFAKVNTDLTQYITEKLQESDKRTPLLITSSAQATLDNPYGKSKYAAEQAVLEHANKNQSPVYIYRLPGIFGKWCKPNYNSVVATFSHNIANDLPIEVSNPDHNITIAYIDDVVAQFLKHLDSQSNTSSDNYYVVDPTFTLSLKELSDRLYAIHNIRESLVVPNLEDLLNKYLYATYISHKKPNDFAYELTKNSDNRGWLAEVIKSKQFGQIFVSKTKPGISRGDHWHHTKIEKFLVVEGVGEVTFRNKINDQEILRYPVSGDNPTVVDIPTGYIHAITNTGETDMVTLFWANEILDKNNPDTHYEKVEA